MAHKNEVFDADFDSVEQALKKVLQKVIKIKVKELCRFSSV